MSVLAGCAEVLGIGQTGDINAPLIPGSSDIDLFVICRRVPSKEERLAMYAPLADVCDAPAMQVCAGAVISRD